MEKIKYGIAETGDGVDFIVAMANATHKSLKDGKLDWQDAPRFLSSFGKAVAAVNGGQEIPKELSDLDDAEHEQLLSQFKTGLDIDDEFLENVSTSGMKAFLGMCVFLSEVKAAKEAKQAKEREDLGKNWSV